MLSLLTWVRYALLLHDLSAGRCSRRAAALTIECFAVAVDSFLSVTLLFPGRHGGEFG